MNLLRYTVIDQGGAVSFIAHGDALPALVKACSFYPLTVEDLLDLTATYYASLREYVLSGLAVFDERNLPGHCARDPHRPHCGPKVRETGVPRRR